MKKIIINAGGSTYAVRLGDILYMEKRLRKIKLVYSADGACGRREIEFYGRFDELMPALDGRFMHCHRSYVINRDRVTCMEKNTVYIEDSIAIYMGRDTYGRARRQFAGYIMKKTCRTG